MRRKAYKYETHLHTKEASACAISTGSEMVKAYRNAGYSGIIVTDHFFNGNTAVPKELPWEVRVDMFCRGYQSALEEATGSGFHVFFGWEYSYHGADFLTYGLDKDFLRLHPDIDTWSIEKYFNVVHQNGGVISHAHPFREAPYIKQIRLYPQDVDAVEIINTSHTNPEFNNKALYYAMNHSLLWTTGSDSHDAYGLNGGGMEFDHELFSINDFIQAVYSNGIYKYSE